MDRLAWATLGFVGFIGMIALVANQHNLQAERERESIATSVVEKLNSSKPRTFTEFVDTNADGRFDQEYKISVYKDKITTEYVGGIFGIYLHSIQKSFLFGLNRIYYLILPFIQLRKVYLMY